MTYLKISLPDPPFISFEKMTLREISETFEGSMTMEFIASQIEAKREEASQLNFLREKLSFEEFVKVAKYVVVVDDQGELHHPNFIVSMIASPFLSGDLGFSIDYYEEFTFLKMVIKHKNLFNQSGMSNILIENINIPKSYTKIYHNPMIHRLAEEDTFQKPLSEYEKVVDFLNDNPDYPDYCFDLIYERYFISLADSNVPEDYEPTLREIYCRSIILGEKSLIEQIKERGVVSFIRRGRLCEYDPPYIVLHSTSTDEEITEKMRTLIKVVDLKRFQ